MTCFDTLAKIMSTFITCFDTLATLMSFLHRVLTHLQNMLILRRVSTHWRKQCKLYDVPLHICKTNVNFTTWFDTLAKLVQLLRRVFTYYVRQKMSIVRRVLTHWQQTCHFYDVF